MFKKIDKIENIRQYRVNKFGLFYLTTNIVLPAIPDLDLVAMGFDKTTTITLVSDFILIQDSKGRCILYDLANKTIIYEHLDLNEELIGFAPLPMIEERSVLCKKRVDGVREAFVYQVDENSFSKFESNYNVNLFDGQLLLKVEHVDPTSISRVGLDSNTLWSHNIGGAYLSELDGREKQNKLNKIIGAHEKMLWVSDFSNELYALHVETGETIHSSKDVGYANYFSLDSVNENLISVARNKLHKIDISNDGFEHTVVSVDSIFNDIECEVDSGGRPMPIIDNHLIFYNKWKSVIGALDINKVSIKWVHDLFDTRDLAMINNIEYFDERLYVMDNSNQLHVFERTD